MSWIHREMENLPLFCHLTDFQKDKYTFVRKFHLTFEKIKYEFYGNPNQNEVLYISNIQSSFIYSNKELEII